MTKWRTFIDPSVGDGQNTINGIIADGSTFGVGISDDLSVTGLSTFSDIARFSSTIRLDGQLRDGDNNFGSSGQVLSSDGTDTRWINAGSLSAGAASQVAINDDSNTNAERFITIVDSSSGNNNIKTDASLKYNPSTNTITTVNITGNVTGNLTGNASSATVLQTTRTIGGVSFNGSANINLPGVNQTGNQNTSGNAGSATVLETTRNFSISGEITANAQSFNGSGNVTLSATVDDNIIDEANLKISNSPQNGFFLKCNTGVSGGLTWSEVSLPTAATLDGTTLASGITASSITSLGTLTGLTVNGNVSVTGTVDGRDLSSDGSKLDGIDSGAKDDQTKAEIDALNINADQLDGQHGSYYRNAGNLNAGTIPDARLANSSLFVTGMILMYTGSTAPSGWAICNGQNGTPDLRDRFIVGAGSAYSVNNTGGSADAILVSHTHNLQNHVHGVNLTTGNQSANHNHTFSGSNTHNHSYTFLERNVAHGGGSSAFSRTTTSATTGNATITISGNTGNNSGNHNHAVSGNTGTPSTNTTDTLGESATNKNLPPYYALMFIMKL